MYEIITRDEESAAELMLEGDVTIQNASELKEQFTVLINQYQTIVVNHEKAAGYDLSYLQILVSLKKSADKSGKHLILKINPQNTFYEIIKSAGCQNFTQVFKINATSNINGDNNG